MKKYLAACALVAQGFLHVPVQAQTLEKIKASGAVTMGVRDSSIPLSYAGADGAPIGFHVDICRKVLEDVQAQLGLARLETRYQLVTSQNRIPLVANGTIDIECGSTTNTQARQKEVAFALTTYVEEVRLAVRADSGIRSVRDLAGKVVVATTGTTSVQHLRRKVRELGLELKDVSLGKDHADSFLLLESGRADAWVLDQGVLRASIANARQSSAFSVVGEVLNAEPIAIMVRKDDPGFKRAVDVTIRKLLASGEMQVLWKKWFQAPIPPRGVALDMAPPESLQRLWAHPSDLPMETFQAP
ncbi:amino acid ABC transporter substrate-binding protein [Alicycliphilus denitrificans]|uniref:ABC-type transporter, periplasmic subunit family 3 n=2 Tax=Alicycliphilus denitrificans TaxID=179636 RepID=F4G7G8_ALIDK|nr:amino acid ABC transporter substrate-binding protein [Alicycliphilus denitrificans]ADU99487.1 extracellular solute-binding protein family 3 [Alicycliphilus denitrificans BC]AEB85498.1 ABC-type transporter, periplasmic subunit family 3 [Alicycliphilus denitrificans K601]QKD43690.1 amino acid ABC transporter substrate-binding protein [Alicycliphilus denitrificans]GAO22754.1 ABC transporter substrate-binding protein [Alicycliphilus sp. B1]